jgi:hypothetical protein
MMPPPLLQQQLCVFLHEPESRCDLIGSQPGDASNTLRLSSHGKLDHSLTNGVSNVNVRWFVFTRRKKDDDAKSADAQNGRHVM